MFITNSVTYIASTAGFRGSYYNSCNITDEVCRGWEAEGGQYHPQECKKQCRVFGRAQKLLVGHDGRQQQFDSPSSLISAHQWPHRLHSRPLWFYRVGKRPPVKADLAIYSPINGMSG